MSAPFIFKEFSIEQDQCAMKIGTDGVLLGAWAPISHQPNSILDIGAGTGVVALMLAQRSLAETIDGVELIPEAYERLLLDTITGDASLFTRADEVETAWGLIDPIIEAWQANDQNIASYLKGTWGPGEAEALLAADGCSWSTWDGRIE